MSQCIILDTIPAFLGYWASVRNAGVEVQLERWAKGYMSAWPELRDLQVADYTRDHLDWRDMAAKHVFHDLDNHIPAILTAHTLLSASSATIYGLAQEYLHLDFPMYLLFYVGIGLGAGWATHFRGKPAVLFGLENIAVCGWANASALAGLTAHELGHVWHAHLRSQAGLCPAAEPWWTLYEEGLAQYCEHLILCRASWHMQTDQPEWLGWCTEQRGWLAHEYLRLAGNGEETRPFFGSWFEVRGYRQTGYFLGHELVNFWRRDTTLESIAHWSANEIADYTQSGLAKLASEVLLR
jgi:hypothetical protein